LNRKTVPAITVCLLLVFGYAGSGLVDDLPRVISGIPFAADYVAGMWPPDWTILQYVWGPLAETVQMGIVSIALATILALPLAFLGAQNTAPNTAIYFGVRGLINLLRTMPALLWAILFVAMVGLGPLAGVFALVCHCVGALGKYFTESVEVVGLRIGAVLESMRIEGASECQVIWYGLLPEVWPLFVNYILTYFEWSIRVGTTLGLVGAGGIGLQLMMTIRMFKRQETLAIILVLIAAVGLIDLGSRFVRAKLMEA